MIKNAGSRFGYRTLNAVAQRYGSRETAIYSRAFWVDAGQQVRFASPFFLLAHQASLRATRRSAAALYDPERNKLANATLCSYIMSQFCCTSVFASFGMTHAEHIEFTPPYRLEAGFGF